MGHSQNSRQSKNQSETGALDTVEDKTIDQEPTEESENSEESLEAEESSETEQAKEELPEETAPEEEKEKADVEAEAPSEEEAEALAPEEEEAEEKEKKEKREKAPEEEEIVEERIYTIPLRRAWIAPRKKRTPRAVRMVRGFIQRHMKIETPAKGEEEEEEGRLVISNEVNEKLWSHGIEKPPRNIRVRAVKDKEGVVTLYLAEGD